MPQLLVIAAAVLGLMLTMSGCASDPSPGSGMPHMADRDASVTPRAPDALRFNRADVDFATEMIPHHAQAVMMARMAMRRARSPQVRELADRIQRTQSMEIDTMLGWLMAWGARLPGPFDRHGHSMRGMGGMPGMMGADSGSMTDTRLGRGFDAHFLVMMIRHHEEGVAIARVELAAGANAEAIQLAASMERVQTMEIVLMRRLMP